MTRGISNPPKTPHRPQGPRPPGSVRSQNGELSPSLRCRIVQAREDGLSWGQIKETFLALGQDIPLSTLRYTLQHHHERVSGITKPRSGRPKKIDAKQKKQIEDKIRKAPSRTMQDLRLTICPLVSSATFKRAVRECFLRKWRKMKRPLLLPQHAEARLRWVYEPYKKIPFFINYF